MITLGLDTCLGACSAALLRDGECLAAASEAMTRGHQERLAPMARDLMLEAGIAFAALHRIGVTVGPGSFTGLRVGLAFAKGLALALDRPCVGVSTLEALAASAKTAGIVAAVIDAGRGKLYFQMFDGDRALTAPDILSQEAAAARLVEVCGERPLTLAGPGAGLLGAAARSARVVDLKAPHPDLVARLAESAAFTPAMPLYLRPPDALPKAQRPVR